MPAATLEASFCDEYRDAVMLALRQQLQVFVAVVVSDAVPVMHDFVPFKDSTDAAFNDEAMLFDVALTIRVRVRRLIDVAIAVPG